MNGQAVPMSEVKGIECTAYFRGIDGLGTCDTECQWFINVAKCLCGKGAEAWDGKEHYTKETQDDR